jgi:hypothetical protein
MVNEGQGAEFRKAWREALAGKAKASRNRSGRRERKQILPHRGAVNMTVADRCEDDEEGGSRAASVLSRAGAPTRLGDPPWMGC